METTGNYLAKKSPHHVDNILLALGARGRFQILQCVMQLLAVCPGVYQLLSHVFTSRRVPHSCAHPEDTLQQLGHFPQDYNTTITYAQCSIETWRNGTRIEKSRCIFGNQYNLSVDISTVSQFDLVCERFTLVGLGQSLVFCGQGIGAVIATFFSDHFGRRTVLVVSSLGLGIVGLVIAWAPNYVVFAVSKFIVGGFQQGAFISCSTFIIELFIMKDRRLTVLVVGLMWSTGVMSLAFISFLFRRHSWRILQTALSCCSVLTLLLVWYLNESLRWLIANGKSKGALQVIQRAANTNKKDFEMVLKAYQTVELLDSPANIVKDIGLGRNEVATNIALEAAKTMTFLDLLKVRRLLSNSVILWFAWFTIGLSYYTIYLTVTSLSGDHYFNFFLTALMEVPTNFLCYFSLNKLGRKITMVIGYGVLGVSILLAGIFKSLESTDETYSTLTKVASFCAIMGASGSFNILFQYTPELFPTNLRGQALGVCSFMCRIGSMLAPFTEVLAVQAVWSPGVLISCCSCVVCLLIKFLPETMSRELPQTLEELESWS